MEMRMLMMKLVNQCQSKEKEKCREGDEKPIEYVAIKETNKIRLIALTTCAL